MTPVVIDQVLPALGVLTDRAALGALLERTGWLDQPRVAEAEVRLRWKPGTNVRAGVVVPTAGGPAALLLAGFPPGDGGKADRLVDRAHRLGAPALRDGTLGVVPAWADPALRGLVPATARPLAYNPDRRWVGRFGRHVVKVHADPVPAAVHSLTARFLPGARSPSRDGRMALARWMPGRHSGVDDGLAVSAALAVLHRTDPPAGLTVLGPEDVLDAAERAASAVAATLPGQRDRLARLLEGLRTTLPAGWPSDRVVLHGDFSPDQVLIRPDGTAALLDLDRAALGPSAWDGAHWTAAQLADGATPLPAPVPVPPPLLAAACLLRAPEPFRRLRPGWAARTMTLLATALVNLPCGTKRSRALAALPAGLTPRRSWPERGGALAVEALTRDGRVVAARVEGTDVTVLDTADPELPALAAAAPGATVIGHRAGRRAVLRRRGSYLKVVRPGRAARVAGGLAAARDLLGADPAAALLPAVLAVDDAVGCVELAELPGPTLHRLLADDPAAADTLAGRTGAVLAVLQSAPGAMLAVHGHREEADVLCRWTADAAAWDAAAWDGADRTAAAEQLAARLVALPVPTWVPAHRDLHDKQIVAVGDRVGLLDLDTLCSADPALDLANLLAHLRLRVLLGHCTAAVAGRCAARLRATAGGRAGAQAVATYTAATLLRLAAVYTFRPGPAGLPDRLASAALELRRVP